MIAYQRLTFARIWGTHRLLTRFPPAPDVIFIRAWTSRGKRTADAGLVSVVLDLSSDEDIRARIDRVPVERRQRMRAARLCGQAYQQGELLSNAGLAELMT